MTHKHMTSTVIGIVMILCLGMTPGIGHTAQPGIDCSGWGTTTWTSNSSSPYTSMKTWLKIVDYDGIANDGSSHTVTVTYPDSSVHQLYFSYKVNDYTAYYNLFDSVIAQPISAASYSGTYRFHVEDSTGQWSETSEEVVVNPINPPVEASFQPNFSTVETLTAHFDDVYVNNMLWDNFDTGFDPLKWSGQPNGVTNDSGEVQLQKTYYTSTGSLWFRLDNEPVLNEFKATVRPDNIFGNSSRARIAARFWNDGSEDVQCHLRIHENNVKFKVFKDTMFEGHQVNDFIIGPITMGPITQDNNYELSMSWDGTTVTFRVVGLDDSVNYSDTYTPQGTVLPPSTPDARLGIARFITFADTTPDLSWDPVPGARYYRVRFYGHRQDWSRFTVFTGYTSDTSYTIPPGVLKPNGYYRYRIEASRDHQWIGDDNRSASNPDLQFVIAGQQEAEDPFVDLWSIGVGTWSSDGYGGNTCTDYYLKVHDAQGVPDNIESVKVRMPDSTTEISLYRDYNDNPTSGRYRGHYFGPSQDGNHIITVTDRDGNTFTTSENLTVDPIDPPVVASFTPMNNTVIGGTAVNFDWDDVSGSQLYQVKIYDQDNNEIYNFYSLESEFDLPAGLLAENSLYRYRVLTRKDFFEQNTDNGSGAPFTSMVGPAFFTTQPNGTSMPSLTIDTYGVSVRKSPNPDGGLPVHALHLRVEANDPDGVPANIERVDVTYPDGTTTRVLTYLYTEEGNTNYFYLDYYPDPSLIQEGAYLFTVFDVDGNQSATLSDTLTNVAVNTIDWATNASPVMDAVLPDNAPTFTWDPVSGASYYKIQILDSWSIGDIYWSAPVAATQFTVPAGVLDPHRVHSYRVFAYRESAGSEVDFFSSNSSWHTINNHFTTGEALDGLAAFASNFGRSDCTFACTGNSDADADIDGADLAMFAGAL